ncbi:MAG: Tex family protein [Candidatus Electrothrix aestuarii]|uniref:Tex family protein n=1 Tax=Candidatus Electrothrix aestuarii TaxID=3062594 RepID=A0AAU8LYU6_9BACT|nr:Tex family protein [Candidatus Electrothrix aestuarii]
MSQNQQQDHRIAHRISQALQITSQQVLATAQLLEEGATVPFISRYRKEVTGSLDETQVAAIRDQLTDFAALEKRRKNMLDSLAERELLTTELEQALGKAEDLTTLEDIFLPYKQKRKTKAVMAREKGLEPLAQALFTGQDNQIQPGAFVDPEKDVHSEEEALAGARDIIAEWISEDADLRANLRRLFADKAEIRSTVVKKKEEEGAKYRDYFDWQEPAHKAPSHRLLAMFRGSEEKVLRLAIRPDEDAALALINRRFSSQGRFREQVQLAVEESYKRLLGPSLENELRADLKQWADQEAIQVFADNLRELLLAPALGQKRVMALDPGFRTGAKLVCLSEQGQLLDFTTVYPTHGTKQQDEAGRTITTLCRKHRIEAIAIGNGTAGRETEQFVRGLGLDTNILITLVNESGASIYSASEVARREFPDHDITVRGAVSIGRRLQDPLAELVKLDPASIGVGQYQHDVNQAALKKALDDVVMHCVNTVGVEVNSGSLELLTYVSGLGPGLAAKIIARREEQGPFVSRKQLLKVPRLGAKAFEQCAGFLRIHGAKNPLDNSAVHPERYAVVEKMAADLGCTVQELMQRKELRDRIDLQRYVSKDSGKGGSQALGLPTLRDILEELARPGRDPRQEFTAFAFADGVNSMDDLIEEMRLPGIVTNVTKFGAFVDIGVHQDGLVHISQLADRFVKDPAEVVKVGQQVTVRVLEVDQQRKRIALSLRER